MAICAKIHSIKARLDERINYAITADKTQTLIDKIDYAINENKTERALYASVVNCDSVETAFYEMNEVKDYYRKTDNVIGYTFIQSFSPNEMITPEQAHEIGVRLAQDFFGDRFQVVVGTHLDKAHLHNHFVINSVSFIDGK
ncbi:MAG TPA: relaxase/mobilization nuclease domain-containing protein, partial [Clostridia bacterium]|nr:relaxase/mobilization nuclease domain-containing protein [Clostridia bacterium]